MASLASGKLGNATVNGMFEQTETERFLEKNILVAVVKDTQCCLFVQNLAISGQPGIKGASLLTPKTLIRAPDSEVLTNHDLLRLDSFASMLLGLVL